MKSMAVGLIKSDRTQCAAGVVCGAKGELAKTVLSARDRHHKLGPIK
jgi:hypothetical protein